MRAPVLLLAMVLAACGSEHGARASAQTPVAAPETGPPEASDGRSDAGAPQSGLGAWLLETWGRKASGQRFQELSVPGFAPAVVHAPRQGGPLPLIVAGHGAGGLPEHECEYWRRQSRGRALILCLRGERTNNAAPSGYYYRTHFALGREFRAALTALRQRFDVAPGAIYTGFSQGAIMGAPMIVQHARDFPYLVLIEGGYEYWSPATARKFAALGGKRVLFACGTRWCAEKSKVPAEWLRRSNVEVRIEHAPGAGHTAGGGVAVRTSAALPWLTAGIGSWSGIWPASGQAHLDVVDASGSVAGAALGHGEAAVADRDAPGSREEPVYAE